MEEKKSELLELVEEYKETLVKGSYAMTVIPNISAKKVQNAIESYAKVVQKDRVLALYDSTMFGSASDGFLITKAGFYYNDYVAKPIAFQFVDIDSVELRYIEKELKDGKIEKNPILAIYPIDKAAYQIENTGSLNLKAAVEFFEKVLELKKQGLIDETDQHVILADLKPEVKLAYTKIIINMFHKDDTSEINEKALSEILIFATQNNFDTQLRMALHQYLSASKIPFSELIKTMDSFALRGSEKILHLSLIKDLIRVHRSISERSSFENNPFILEVAEELAISKEEIEIMELACHNDEQILDGNLDDDAIAQATKDLAARAGAVGVPIAAVYISGSVVGLSAAGIASGLASLGLGGILGLSSMVTGVGVCILIGVAAYNTISWLTGGGQRDKASKREIMLEEILSIHNKTVVSIFQDVNYLANRIHSCAKEDNFDRSSILKLSEELTVFSGVAIRIQKRSETLQERELENRGENRRSFEPSCNS